MTTDEMMKKMGLREDLDPAKKNNGQFKNQILKYLKDGKNKLLLLENQIEDGKNYKKLLEEVDLSRKKLQEAKRNFDKYEKKAEHYIAKNPKKAIAMAAAAGVLAVGLWSAFKGKKPVHKKRKPAV
jgi:ElaB/YqjD/DUF883 family membrane-anchored ribosome-binding protein